MRIKRLEMSGFKSFVERTALNFPPGIAGIVGPNGCGKSNIGDAIRWVLGEQAISRLRGHGLNDLIFNGSEGAPPLGMAEVSVLFDVEPGDLGGDYAAYSEIMVTRRLFRSGETESFINNIPCRLKDIIEFFQGTGLGARAYSMVEQGQIEHLVHARPEDRRILIEELAGVSRFKGRRLAAERKMESTRQNLVRVKDILGEVDKQVLSLTRQAKRAERYKKIKEEVRGLELDLVSRRHGRLDEACREKSATRESLEARGRELRRSIENLDRSLASGRESSRAQEERFEEARQVASRQEAEARRLEQESALAEIKIRELEEGFQRFEGESGERRNKREEIAGEIATLESAGAEVQEALEIEVARLAEKEAEAETLLSSGSELESRIETCKSDLVSLMTEAAEVRNRILQWDARSQELVSEQAKMDRLADEGRSGIKDLEGQWEARSQEIQETRAGLARVLAEREKAQNEILRIRNEQEKTAKKMEIAKETISGVRSRSNSLLELQKKYEGFQEGVRSIMLRRNGSQDGPHLVAEVMEALPPFERAVAAALGERLQCIIVESHEAGLEAIRFLRENSAGRGTFIPFDVAKSDGESRAELIDPLLGRVRVQEGFEGVASFLLGDVDLVPDVATGLSRWKDGARRGVHVTPEGDVILPSGMLSGGEGGSMEEKILTRRREIKELEDQAGNLDGLYRELNTLKGSCDAELSEKERLLKKSEDDIQDLRLRALAAEKDVEKIREGVESWKDRLQVMEYERGIRRDEARVVERDLAQAREGLADLVRREEDLKSLAERLQRENAVGSQAVGAVQGAVVALKVQVAKLRERMEHFHRALERLYTMARELDAEEETRQLDLARNREELARQKERAGQIAKDREMIGGEIDAHRRAIEILADERHGGSRQLMAWEDERTVLRSDLENIEVERGVAQVEATEKKMEMERLKGEMWDRYGVDIALAEKPDAFDVTEEDEARLERLKEDLRRIGDVNLDSISELEELRTRQAFLSSQKDDLEKSLDDLARTVSHLNREFRTRFLATFENVSQRLGEVFPKLFSGGHARLVLTDEEDVLDSGIDIVAQPPGKKLQSIGLLSGGEKALTALALIFSVFLIKPAPFCLLDEVDAALDDANIDRFNDLVREMSGLSQLILVTHNKKTMELANCLYGITMQQPGKSRIVSVSLE